MNKKTRGRTYILANIIKDKGEDSMEFQLFKSRYPISFDKMLKRAKKAA
jgi:hypothetical protein